MSSEESRECEEPVDTSSDAEKLEHNEIDSKELENDDKTPEGNDKKKKKEKPKDKKSIEDKNSFAKVTLEEKFSSKMFTYARETICFFLAVVFTALAALHSSPPRISKPPMAKPFFNESSLVLDFYKGHLGALVDRVTDSDFTFVMYYAPWDAECQAMKDEFEKVARYYHSQVFFAAVNCWHPGSECRARYNKIQSYPVLMVYPSRDSGVQYKGIRTAPYMIRFIHTFMNPITRIKSDDQLLDLLKSYDAVMIGYFKFESLRKSPGYREFYRTALRTLEKDPNGEIAFAVITNPETCKDHGVVQFPSASLLMWNETLFYPDSHVWQAENLSNWIKGAMHRVVTWLQPPGSKSSTFAPYLWDGPVLFLFTPRNPLHFENENYNLLREIALQYYDCSDNPQVEDITMRLRQSRAEAALKAFEKRQNCMSVLEEVRPYHHPFPGPRGVEKPPTRHTNETASCCSDTPTNKCIRCASSGSEDANRVCAAPGAACRGADIFALPLGLGERASTAPNSGFTFFNGHDGLDGTCSADSCEKEPTPSVETEEFLDPQSASSVRYAHRREECRRFLAAYSYQRPVFPHDSVKDSAEVTLTERICKINKTLALVAIDSLYYFHFAEGLGIDITRAVDKTAVVILDPSDESQFVLQEPYSRNNLVEFINNYTEGYLRRTMRSNVPKRFVRSHVPKSKCKKDAKSSICIPELSSENFLETVLDPTKDVVVMYHSPYCAFCSAVAYVYLTVAFYLAKMDHLEFVRIDGDNNDLPWEYTMNRYPSILFFPAKRKEDSTLYPWTLPVTVGNLLGFVLANLDEESHVEALVNVCAAGMGGSPNACLERTRWLCLDVIEDHLQELRRLRRFGVDGNAMSTLRTRRRAIALKLEHVRAVHLILGSTVDLSRDAAKAQMLRKRFKRFYEKLANLERDKANSTSPRIPEFNSMEERSL